jgi:iron(II)-dependent oxidoreductase
MALAQSICRSPFDPEFLKRTFRKNRSQSDGLFSLVKAAIYERPLPRRNPFIFYLGHLPVFSYVTLARAFELPPIDAHFEQLFIRGIDPASDDEATALQPEAWPTIEQVEHYSRKADAAIERLLDRANEHFEHPMLVNGEALFTILEHEQMHQETLMYLMTCLADDKKNLGVYRADRGFGTSPQAERITIPGGRVTLGARRSIQAFGWDNEFDETYVDVPSFALDSLPVTNGQFLEHVRQGATAPLHWFERNGEWFIHTALGALALPLDWPVYASNAQAQQFARSRNARLMTEPEYHRAAFGTPEGTERLYPWGDNAPNDMHGNFNFRRMLPEPVGVSPTGRSAWGVHELIGNGWEMTATPFLPLPGFVPMASYPQYSADFFDGQHFVVKGASPVTAQPLIRRSLRNWFFADYPYAFTKFRLAYDHG